MRQLSHPLTLDRASAELRLSFRHAPSLVAGLYVLLMYPVVHLYHYHSIIGNIPRVLDGVFGIVTILVSVFLFVALCKRLMVGGYRLNGVVLVGTFFAFLFLASAWVVVHYLLASGPRGGAEAFAYYGRMIVTYLGLFLAGAFLRVSDFRRVWLLLFVVIFFSLALHIDWDRLVIDLRNVVDPAHRGAYLGLSTTAMFTIFIAWAIANRPIVRLATLVIGVVVLFFLGSRANLAGYLMVLPIALAFTVSMPKQLVIYGFGGVVLAVGLFAMGGIEWLMASRHGQFFALDQMTSLIARNQLLIDGLSGIAASPVYGDYAGQLLMGGRGSIGSYIHNTLSVWQAFGLMPFLLFTGLLLWGVVIAGYTLFMKGRNASRHDQLLAVLATLIFVLSIAAKSVGWAHVAFVWGLLASHYIAGLRFVHRGST